MISNKKSLSTDNINSPTKLKHLTGCGILPYSIHKGQKIFLLGREAKYTDWPDGHKWADFAGLRDKGESIKEATIREGYEEIMGLLTKQDIEKKIKKDKYLITYDSITFLIKIPYNPNMCKQFDLFYQYMINKYPKSFFEDSVFKKGTFEKDQIKYYSFNEIKELAKNGILRRAMTEFIPQINDFCNS